MTESRPEAVSTVQINNEAVVVTEWRFPPGAETGWHRHTRDYVVVPQTDGNLLMETRDQEVIAELAAGRSYFRNKGVEHNVVNDNEHEFVFIEIEVKTG